MDNNSQIRSLEQTEIYIYSIDFKKIIYKMVKQQNWFEDDALETSKLYRNYLFLVKKYGEKVNLIPSSDIDEFWHNHILDTQNYVSDCNAIFGNYLHHYPYFGNDGISDKNDVKNAFHHTQKLHFKEFGKYITPTRSRFPAIIYRIARKLSPN